MAADHSENLHKLLESASDDLQNLNLTLISKLVEQFKELVEPQLISIRQEIAAYERVKADVEETVARLSEWMKNVMKQAREHFREAIVTSQPEDLMAFEMYLRYEFYAEFDEAVNGVISTTKPPRRDGFGKDLIMKFFTLQLELQVATQKNQDKLEEIAKKVAMMKESMENTKKQLEELERITEWVQNALPYRELVI